jgi:Tfp pilus assembly protein PilX
MKRFSRVPLITAHVTNERGHVMNDQRDEGASVLAVLVFTLVIVFVAVAVGRLIASDVKNAQAFSAAREDHNAAVAAAEVALQSIRYTPLLGTGQTLDATAACWGSGSPSSVTTSGVTATAWCSTVWQPQSMTTRVVTIDVCTSGNGLNSATSCATSPTLQAVVTFNDYTPGELLTQNECTTTCGNDMTVSEWKGTQ